MFTQWEGARNLSSVSDQCQPVPPLARSVPSPPAATYVPTPSLRPTAPFAVYFCSPTMIKVLTSAGINPRRRGTSLGPYVLKLHPLSDLKDSSLSHTFGSSRLRGKSGAMLIVNISTSLAAGVRWDVADDGMYCTNDVPLQPSYLHSAYCFNYNELVRTWGGDITEGPPRPPPPARPHWAQQQQHSPTDDVLDSQADYRLQAHTQAPIPPPVLPDEETPTEDVGQGDPLQYSAATMGALTHLLTQIDGATSTLSSTLTPQSYAALAALPLSYPWSSLVLDLKDLLPILDRYVLCCLLASSAAAGEPLQNDQVLTPLLKTLAQTIVNIISPQASLNTRPILPKEIYKVEFWRAHLNYACHRAYEAALPGGSAARLAGAQLCHWNTLAPDSVLKATHLVVFLPPCLGAFVLSNHSSHSPAFFKYPPPELQTNEGLTACVKQVANYPLPSILVNQEEKLSSARKSAADGYLSSYTIPLLAEPETLAQHAKLNWVLRFPLPPPNQMSTSSGAVRLHTKEEYQLPGATVQALPPPIEKYFFGQISLDQLILLLDNAPNDPGALQQAVHNFRSSKRARIDVASIPRQPVTQPPPPPFSPPTSPQPPPPLLPQRHFLQLLLSRLRFPSALPRPMLLRTSPVPPQIRHLAVELHAANLTLFFLPSSLGIDLLHGIQLLALNR